MRRRPNDVICYKPRSIMGRAFKEAERTFEELGEREPFWAVLSQEKYRGTDVDLEEFFSSGQRDISYHLQKLEELGLTPERQSCLDFGCGVGRLSNALAEHFMQVHALDIASSMLERAESLKRHDNIEFVLNKQPDLRVFEDESFDLIYSDKTLQHIPYPQTKAYLEEFLRVLKPDGVAVFMIPDGMDVAETPLFHRLVQMYRNEIRPFFKRARGKPPIQIHPLSKRRVGEIVGAMNGQILNAEVDPAYAGSTRLSPPTFYWVTRAR